MGGKKQAQRTKQSSKPSSSGRSAELFSASSPAKFLGFKRNQSSLSNFLGQNGDQIDPNLDQNFVIVFKKMYKKDPISRHKALQELINLCKSSSSDTINEVLPTWITVYQDLIIDVEHRIREAAQQAHRIIVNKVGRNLAPYIKQIAPHWFISQYDTHAPAASAASLAFKEAFPPHKVADVITFCQKEILQYISDNLTSVPAANETLEKKQKEELEAKYERLIISSLNGYANYLNEIPRDKFESVTDINHNLISSGTFWKFSKHKTGNVRAAWFSLVSTLFQKVPFIMDTELKRAVNAVLFHINDHDPVVLPNVWDATLHLVNNFPNCWEHINMEKAFLPNIVNIINQGGQGNASYIFPNLILLFSKIPESALQNKQTFFFKIFSSFQTGSKRQSITQSIKESKAFATSFNECFRYFIHQHIDDLEFCFGIINIGLEIVNFTMVDPLHCHLIAPFYSFMVDTLVYWEHNKTNYPNYEKLIQHFWPSLTKICIDNIINNPFDEKILQYVYECEASLLYQLSNQTSFKEKKKLKVQFANDPLSEEEIAAEELPVDTTEFLSPDEDGFNTQISYLIKALSKQYFEIGSDSGNIPIKHLTIKQVWSVSKVLQQRHIEYLVNGVDGGIFSIVDKWLADVEIPAVYLVGLVFCISGHLKDEDNVAILADLLKVRSQDMIQEAVRIVLNENSSNQKLNDWLMSDNVKTEICGILEKTSDETIPLFSSLLLVKNDRDFIFGSSTALAILDVLEEKLKTNSAFIQTANVILKSLFTSPNHNGIEAQAAKITDILRLLFQVILTGNHWDMTDIWQMGIKIYSSIPRLEELFENHINNCADFIANYFNSKNEINVNNAVKSSIMLLNAIVCEDETKTNAARIKLSTKFISTVISHVFNKWKNQIEIVCYNVLLMNGTIQYDEKYLKNVLAFCQGWDSLSNINCFPYFFSLSFCVKYLAVLTGVQSWAEIETNTQFSSNPINIQNDGMLEYFLEICHGFNLSKTLVCNFPNTEMCFIAQNCVLEIEYSLKELVQTLSEQQQIELLEMCKTRSVGGNSLWKETYTLINKEFLDDYVKVTNDIETVNLDLDCLYRMRHIPASSCHLELLNLVVDNYKVQPYYAFEMNLEHFCGFDLCQNSEIAWFFEKMIKSNLNFERKEKIYDFIMVSLASWWGSIALTKSTEFKIEFVRFVTSVCNLHETFIKTQSTGRESESDAITAWQELFACDTFLCLCRSWKELSDDNERIARDYTALKQVTLLSQMICFLSSFDGYCLPYETLWADKAAFLNWFNIGVVHIVSNYIPIQISSYEIMLNILPFMVKLDTDCDEESLDNLSCHNMLLKLVELQEFVTDFLKQSSMTATNFSPHSVCYTKTLGYLLMWSLFLKTCQACDNHMCYLYTSWIKQQSLITQVIENIVGLMPETIIDLDNLRFSKKQELFSKTPDFSLKQWTCERLNNLCCWLYCDLLRTLPALIRQWSAEADSKFLSYIDKMTLLYVSPLLCLEEMKAVKEQQKAFENMKVQTFPSAREVVASYTIEESAMELVIKLAPNHPLTPPKVETSTSSQTKFIMQLSLFLTHQNGSIWDGLMLWKNNLDKKFEGTEECYICFSILHNATQQLPKMSCQTCKKKFHSYCLFKWFTTSNKSTCPICRNHF